jgi:hypothetical protein
MTRERCPRHGRTRITIAIGSVTTSLCPDCRREDVVDADAITAPSLP